MSTTITIAGPIPSGLPNAGTQGTNSITIDDSPASQAFIMSYLYEINFRPTIPDPTWTPTVDDGQGNQISNPTPQGQVPNTTTPGDAFLVDLWTNMKSKAGVGAAKLDAVAIAEATAAAAQVQAGVASVTPTIS